MFGIDTLKKELVVMALVVMELTAWQAIADAYNAKKR